MKQLHLFMKDNDSAVTANAGTHLVISLEGNPTTGFEWVADEIDATVVTNLHSKYVKGGSVAIGGGGAFVFTLTASGKGTGKVSFKYWRRWQGNASVSNRFGIQITVI